MKKVLICLLVSAMVLTMNFKVYANEDLKPAPAEGREVRVIDPEKPMVALTFDDGPSALHTSEILDVLKENDAKGTFFVLGSLVIKNPELTKRIMDEGHQLGNHTYNHKDLTAISDDELYMQIVGTDDLIENATGQRTTVMRPPYGRKNQDVVRGINKPVIIWSLDTKDWEDRDADVIEKKVMDNVKDGDIILMHDIYGSTAEAVGRIVPQLINQGYQLVTVDELYEYSGKPLVAGQVYNNAYK